MTKDQIRDKRLQKLYGITLEEYNALLDFQGGVCAICYRPPVNLPLSVDHDHKHKYLKIGATCTGNRYKAYTMCGIHRYDSCLGEGRTKNEAKRDLRRQLKRASVRGLLSHGCNTGLRKFSDNPDNLYRAAEYLRKHQQPTEG